MIDRCPQSSVWIGGNWLMGNEVAVLYFVFENVFASTQLRGHDRRLSTDALLNQLFEGISGDRRPGENSCILICSAR